MHHLKRKLSSLIFAVIVLLFSLFICIGTAPKDHTVNENGKIKIIATTTMIADLVKTIGGDYVDVTGLMGPGIDPHAYQASAGDVTSMQSADIVFYHGLHLEGKMGDIFGQLTASGRPVACIEDGIDPADLLTVDDAGTHDPHIWFDVGIWKQAARYTADYLSSYDPAHENTYQLHLTAYLTELDALEQYIHTRVNALDPAQRKLVTAHDAFGYFGRAYGFEVIGLQGISTDAEAGTADVSALAAYIAESGVNAVFVETSVSPKTIQALQAAVLAKGHQVKIGGELYSDSLGDEASGAQTYIGTVRANTDTIVDALLDQAA